MSPQRSLQFWGNIDQNERAQVGIVLLQTVVTLVGGIAIFWNIVLARKQMKFAQQQIKLAQDQIITEMFSRAIEQLGHDKSSVRMGAIYSLERVARDSAQDHCSVMEVTASYGRDRSHITDNEDIRQRLLPGKDIQAAITVLGRRNPSKNSPRICLTSVDLRGINFAHGQFENAEFYRSNLSNDRTLSGDRTNLFKINLKNSNCYRVNFSGVQLREADLSGADLHEANLFQARMKDCIFTGANLDKADLREALYLTVEQVKDAKNWQSAIYDPPFARLLGL